MAGVKCNDTCTMRGRHKNACESNAVCACTTEVKNGEEGEGESCEVSRETWGRGGWAVVNLVEGVGQREQRVTGVSGIMYR